MTRVAGVASPGTVTVRVRPGGGATVPAPAVRTSTDPAARFFGLVVDGAQQVRDVTALDAAGTAAGR